SISSGRHWVRTWMVTSSGTRSSSTSWRTKSKSGWDAEGKPTSISLKPILTTVSNMRRLRTGSIGSMRAWLPSRRSTEHQRGAFSIRLFGQVRSSSTRGRNGRYFSKGIFLGFVGWGGIGFFLSRATKKPPAGRAGGCRRAPISGRPPYIRRSPEVARRDSIPLILRQRRRSVKCGARSGGLPLGRTEPVGLGRGLVGIAPVGLRPGVVAAGRGVEDLARQLGLDGVGLRADPVVGRHPLPLAGRFLGLAGGGLPGGPGLRGFAGPGRGGGLRVGGRRDGDLGGGHSGRRRRLGGGGGHRGGRRPGAAGRAGRHPRLGPGVGSLAAPHHLEERRTGAGQQAEPHHPPQQTNHGPGV